jgi:hypothetical protein
MQSLAALVNLVRYKVSGDQYHHELFRVGMTLSLDPTPFILAGEAIKAKLPSEAASGMVSVNAVGTLVTGTVRLTRLYFGEAGEFLQLWVDPASGNVAECRFFSRLDQEVPPDEAGWGVWLNEENGLIGWPQFQTLDGKLYDRQWSPGESRIEPRAFEETATSVNGAARRSLRAMLYGAATGLAEPAPAREYLLVSAVEEGAQAWVDLEAGIDLNPAALSLA